MAVEINPDRKVSELLDVHPKVLETLVAVGFTPLRIPGVRAMMAHTLTLREACTKRDIDLQMVLQRLHQACNTTQNTGENHG